MRGPNHEQKLAIDHSGGVLLSAGAGSGKTYVLVEHVVYLIKKFHYENTNLIELNFKSLLRDYLSGIVLMTFTNKAAGEISIRLEKRIELEASMHLEKEEGVYWVWTKEVIDSINISTIHGLCFQLLKKGYFPKYENNLEIISEVEILQRIKELLGEWFVQYKKDTDYRLGDKEEIESVISHQESLIASLTSIFLDPQLRKMWQDIQIEDLTHLEDDYLFQIFKLQDISYLFEEGVSLGEYSEYSDKKWYVFLNEFNQVMKKNHSLDSQFLSSFSTFFQKHKGVRAPLKRLGLDSINQSMDDIKIFRDFINKNFDDYTFYFKYKDTGLKDWLNIFLEIFKYIDNAYGDFYGVTFSDLEFYVYESLKNDEYKNRVNSDYRYFIVDEFQDTSSIQFAILEKLCNSDFSKVFCVGDVKQAIYGFRGGEIAVFEKCRSLVKTNLFLSNNYRSDKNIINFNNDLFDHILPLGKNFKGADQFSVKSDGQLYPDVSEDKKNGIIKKISTELNLPQIDKGKSIKLAGQDVNFLEASSIVKQIKNIRKTDENAEICILYKNLAPSEFLVSRLLEEKIGFTAQVKIPIEEDPIISIFRLCLEFYLCLKNNDPYDSKTKYICFQINGHLEILSGSSQEVESLNITQNLTQFTKDIILIGIKDAFYKFLFSIDIYNGDPENNISLVESLISMGRDDVEKVYSALLNYGAKKYSAYFISGNKNTKLKIMTTHASKGLEFDYVFLAGIHTNGRRMPELNYFGKMPGSCRFKTIESGRKTYKTPMYILEGLINEHKDFSESKRLLYVACTRAVKGLSWCDFHEKLEAITATSNSWIKGLRNFEKCNESDLFEKETCEMITFDPDKSISNRGTPFFHQDPGGVVVGNQGTALLTTSELSVTRLSSIADCPRKFYLMNICKIDEGELEDISLIHDSKFKNKNQEKKENQKVSSSERGSLLHYELSKCILKNLTTCLNQKIDLEDQKIINSVLTYLNKQSTNFDFISEKQIKFSLFGSMISGIPDLVLRPKDGMSGPNMIIDFKTGQNLDDNESYWCQLYCYAYAEFLNEHTNIDEEIKLILYYIDTDERIEKSLNFTQVKSFLLDKMKDLNTLQKINKNHCPKCSYNTICY